MTLTMKQGNGSVTHPPEVQEYAPPAHRPQLPEREAFDELLQTADKLAGALRKDGQTVREQANLTAKAYEQIAEEIEVAVAKVTGVRNNAMEALTSILEGAKALQGKFVDITKE